MAAAHAERGVLHRDLKPSNVMIDGDGNVRITDFGIATTSGDSSTEIAGTPQYMAPEQFTGQPASIKTDIYALGLISLRDLHRAAALTTPKRSATSGNCTTRAR